MDNEKVAIVKVPYKQYVKKSLLWFVLNGACGVSPLLFMCFVFFISQRKVGHDEIKHLINDGVILFVCCAIMGSVLIDFLLGGFKVKGIAALAIIAIPGSVLVLISFDYLLFIMKIIDGTCFALSSLTTKCVIVISLFYCIFTKANLYIKEDTRHELV